MTGLPITFRTDPYSVKGTIPLVTDVTCVYISNRTQPRGCATRWTTFIFTCNALQVRSTERLERQLFTGCAFCMMPYYLTQQGAPSREVTWKPAFLG